MLLKGGNGASWVEKFKPFGKISNFVSQIEAQKFSQVGIFPNSTRRKCLLNITLGNPVVSNLMVADAFWPLLHPLKLVHILCTPGKI